MAQVQAQLWSELLSSRERLEYMLFPRLLAIAEVAWSSNRDWPGFLARVEAASERWRERGINHRAT